MKKVIPLKKIILRRTEEEVTEILAALREDYNIPVRIKKREIKVLLEEFYDYYEKKGIQYAYREMMIGHMEDIAISADQEEVGLVDIGYILRNMKLLELLDSPMEVVPKETKKVLKRIKSKLEGEYEANERKRRKKL